MSENSDILTRIMSRLREHFMAHEILDIHDYHECMALARKCWRQ